MLLLLLVASLTLVFFVAGFLAPPRPWQRRSQAGFVGGLMITALAAYYAWRQSRTVAELAGLIEPVPAITSVTTVPTSAERAALSRYFDAMYRHAGDSSQIARRQSSGQPRERRTDYWLLKTALPLDSVFAFYRQVAVRRGWNIETDSPPWLRLRRGDEAMVLFVTDDFPRSGTTVLYGYTPGR